MTGIFDTCAYCSKPVERQRPGRKRIYCDKSCAMFARSKHGRARAIVVDPETGCHTPERKPSANGYHIYKYKCRRTTAHRVVWMEANGPIPPGMHVDHLCRNRACVNLEHLEVVTPAENMRRSPRVKLTWADAEAIRASTEAAAGVAKRYGVSTSLVYQIRNGRCWTEPPTMRDMA